MVSLVFCFRIENIIEYYRTLAVNLVGNLGRIYCMKTILLSIRGDFVVKAMGQMLI